MVTVVVTKRRSHNTFKFNLYACENETPETQAHTKHLHFWAFQVKFFGELGIPIVTNKIK